MDSKMIFKMIYSYKRCSTNFKLLRHMKVNSINVFSSKFLIYVGGCFCVSPDAANLAMSVDNKMPGRMLDTPGLVDLRLDFILELQKYQTGSWENCKMTFQLIVMLSVVVYLSSVNCASWCLNL